ncbi:hypothetical protein [Acinetobacter sp. YH12025]|uniref:hypothetical protein n=1 Tax=Acinetobacter sp. YH12025 TaxID=2601042 RepID=UPI0015D3C14E|nr:hypothetical protein [Acinetobacter sp. YH12025]
MIKQTQTKLFNFADTDLDLCPGSKGKFPTAFKKMLAIGYNSKIVSSATIDGNQVTLDYGVSHGYAADRVLAINTPGLIGEFYIDSVTSNTLTITVSDAPASIIGGFTTKIAPLGWELVYELNNIHIYKMKHIDDTDRYVRMCFQNNAAHRNAIAVCIGKTFDAETGFINDPLALQSTAAVATPNQASLPRWDGYLATSSHNNYTYSQGYSSYGKAIIIGSIYHIALLMTFGAEPQPTNIYGIFAAHCHTYDALDYPVVVARNANSNTSNSGDYNYGNFYSGGYGHASIGNISVRFDNTSSANNRYLGQMNPPASAVSVLSTALDTFNTTTAKPLEIYEMATSQYLGCCYGVYHCMFANDANAPTISITNLPVLTTDIDFNNQIYIFHSGSGSTKDRATYLAFPLEEIKVGY